MNKRGVVLINELNEEKTFPSVNDAAIFLNVVYETLRIAIKNNTTINGWKVKPQNQTTDSNFKPQNQTTDSNFKPQNQTTDSNFKPQIQTTDSSFKRVPFALCHVPGIEIDIDNIDKFKGRCSLRKECDSCHRYLTWQCDPSNYKFFPPKDVEPNISYVAPIIEKDIPTRKVRK